jgi:2'-5' RNA ligase
MRTFIALNLPAVQRQELHDATADIRAAVETGTWVAAEKLHLTLKFLGEVDESRVKQIAQRIGEVAGRHRPLELDVGGAGVFPNFRAPRIVWMGVAADTKLELLFDDVERACDELGFPPEGRAFRPHITLGRLRVPPSSTVRRRLEEAMANCTVRLRVAVNTVDVMASTLKRDGSRYTVVAAESLGEER